MAVALNGWSEINEKERDGCLCLDSCQQTSRSFFLRRAQGVKSLREVCDAWTLLMRCARVVSDNMHACCHGGRGCV